MSRMIVLVVACGLCLAEAHGDMAFEAPTVVAAKTGAVASLPGTLPDQPAIALADASVQIVLARVGKGDLSANVMCRFLLEATDESAVDRDFLAAFPIAEKAEPLWRVTDFRVTVDQVVPPVVVRRVTLSGYGWENPSVLEDVLVTGQLPPALCLPPVAEQVKRLEQMKAVYLAERQAALYGEPGTALRKEKEAFDQWCRTLPNDATRDVVIAGLKRWHKELGVDSLQARKEAFDPKPRSVRYSLPDPVIWFPPSYAALRLANGSRWAWSYVWASRINGSRRQVTDVSYQVIISPQKNEWRIEVIEPHDDRSSPVQFVAYNIRKAFHDQVPKDRSFYFFTYLLRSGASWQGPIGREIITLTAQEGIDLSKAIVGGLPTTRRDDHTLVWQLENVDPVVDVDIAVPADDGLNPVP